MINEILNKLNEEGLEFTTVSPNKNGDNQTWNIHLRELNLLVEVSVNQYDSNKVQLKIFEHNREIKNLVDYEEIEPFLTTLRKYIQQSWCQKNVSEEKRVELINLYKEAPTTQRFGKEIIEKTNGNEVKKYFFRKSSQTIEDYELNQLKFNIISITELTGDSRIPNQKYTTKDYQLLLSNRELCEIFKIDLNKEKEESFNKIFGDRFNSPQPKKTQDNSNSLIEENNEEIEVKSNISDYAVSFYIIEDNRIALSELTLLGDLGKDYADLIKNKEDKKLFLSEIENVSKVFFFSRLNVPEKLREKGFGKLLMQKTLEFCEANNVMLINTVNPYGEMDLKQLNDFYQKCGMKLVNKEGLLIYSPNMKNIIFQKIKP